MSEEYAMKIELIFYLKENENLTNEERNIKIINVLKELEKEAIGIGRNRGVSMCKNALENL